MSNSKTSRPSKAECLTSHRDPLSEAPAPATDRCPSCGSSKVSVFYELKGVPVQSVLLVPTRQKAIDYPRGDIALSFCEHCGFVFNSAFDPALVEYSSIYEATQGFSPTFSAFARDLAGRLIDRHDLHHKTVLEIGCGNGEFLSLLCELGDNRGVGFDPAYVAARGDSKRGSQITFIKDFYSEKYGHYLADFVCCKMTLEHIHRPADFVGMVRGSIGGESHVIVFFQVPDVTRILANCTFEDIYYEHCSYFSPGSLARLFRKCGFDVIRLDTEYDGQYLMIEARPSTGERRPSLPLEEDLETITQYVSSFGQRCQDKLHDWQKRLQNTCRNGKKVVVWGSGSKAVAFLTTLKLGDAIKHVIDINPRRQRTYMAGTGQQIVAPEFLRGYRPDIVIVMNSVYCDEIKNDLERMNLAPELLTL